MPGVEVRVSDYFEMDGLNVWIAERFGAHDRRLLRLHDDGSRELETIDPLVQVQPTFKLTNDEARALLDALLRHYQGASDMHTVRSDLLHERERVDKLTSGLLQIAIHATSSQWAASASPPANRFQS